MEPPRLSAARLAPAVRRCLQAPDAWPLQWSCEPLDVSLINPSTAGLYRVLGTARLGEGGTAPWRMVLKVLHLPDFTGTPLESGYIKDPEDWNYWKREVLARRSGLPDLFTVPLRPVRCWEAEEMDDHTAWLLLEDLDNPAHSRSRPDVADWSCQALADAAYDLGAFAAQGVSLADTVQAFPWAAQNWLRGWIATFRAVGGDHAASHPGCWQHPLVRDRLPASAQESFSALMVRAELLLQRLDEMPMSVAHLDLQASNLFPDAGPEGHRTVVIDWGLFGVAPIGEDLGYHISQNVLFGVVRPNQAQEHERTATEAYLSGLRAFGWQGNDHDVRFTANATGALRMLPFAVTYLADLCPEFGDVEPWPEIEAARQKRDVYAVMDEWCQAVGYLTASADRALRALADS